MELQDTKMENQESDEKMDEMVSTLRMFMGDDIELSTELIKLALKKTNLQLEETILMLTNEEQVIDLQQDLRKEEENN